MQKCWIWLHDLSLFQLSQQIFFFLTTVRLPQFVGVCTVLCIHEIIRNRWNFICMLHTLTPMCRLVNLNHISFWIRKKKKIQHRDTDRILMFTGEKGSSTDINISVKTASLPLNTCFNRLALLSWESNGREENR